MNENPANFVNVDIHLPVCPGDPALKIKRLHQ